MEVKMEKHEIIKINDKNSYWYNSKGYYFIKIKAKEKHTDNKEILQIIENKIKKILAESIQIDNNFLKVINHLINIYKNTLKLEKKVKPVFLL